MKTLRKLVTLGAALTVVAGSLVLGSAPASAATHDPVIGYTHYENVGNPGWCLDGSGTGFSVDFDEPSVYLHRCGHRSGEPDHQLWGFTNGATDLQLVHTENATCLVSNVLGGSITYLRDNCSGRESRWTAVGKNGWVMLVNSLYPNMCLAPFDTGVGGFDFYWVGLIPCDPNNLRSVPNIVAWRYFN